MAVRPVRRPVASEGRARRMVGLGVAGVAGVSSVLAVAPHALAEPVALAVPASAPLDVAPAAAPEAPAATPLVPDYGIQKFRVGVQVKSGAYVPPGTTTVGTKLEVTVTPQEGEGDPVTLPCTTVANTDGEPTDSPSASYCDTLDALKPPALGPEVAAARPALTQQPDSHIPPGQTQAAPPGATITVRQVSVNQNLVTDPAVSTIAPCEASVAAYCVDGNTGLVLGTSVTFDDAGLPPTAAPDTATTAAGQAVTIDVFANDDTVVGAPVTGESISTPPAHGTATFTGGPASGDPTDGASAGANAAPAAASAATPPATTAKVVYTPAAGFSGVDRFAYSYSTANGTATATVTVTVTAPPSTPSTPPSSGSAPVLVSTSAPLLAQTGSDDVRIALLGGALVATGGAVLAFGRRRAAQHAR